ncbi:MAG: GyrI-like domain-containing protein [Flavobacteriaceae bacterium]|jgi:effector-binding domain-containing protein|nr:GyrI-like domain-containing protein [Flavobacteriaceae bacterium]
MRILKYLLLLIILTVVTGSIFILTQSSSYTVTSETESEISENTIFEYVKDLKNWEAFCFYNQTKKIILDCSDINSSLQKCTGNDYIEEIENTKVLKDSLMQNIVWFNGHKSQNNWTFESIENNKTRIIWTTKGELSFIEKIKKNITGGIPLEIRKTQEEGLKNLNKVLAEELNTYEIEENGIVTIEAIHYLQIKAETDIAGFYPKVNSVLPYLEDFFNKNAIERAGLSRVIFDTYDEKNNKVLFSVCIPTKEEIFTTPDSEITESSAKTHKAVKVTLIGDYKHSKKAWDAAFAYIEKHDLEIDYTGSFSEIYVVNSLKTSKSPQWKTEIYIPIKTVAHFSDSNISAEPH